MKPYPYPALFQIYSEPLAWAYRARPKALPYQLYMPRVSLRGSSSIKRYSSVAIRLL